MTRPLRTLFWGLTHEHAAGKLASLRKLSDDFEIVAIVDDRARTAPRHLNEVADTTGLRLISEAEADRVDGIDVAFIETANADLMEIAATFIAKGVPLHCDKPCGEAMEPYRSLVETCRVTNLPFQIGYMYRGNPAIRFAWQFVADGGLGDVAFVEADMNHDYGEPNYPDYIASFKGGILYNLGCHLVDMVLPLVRGELREAHPFLGDAPGDPVGSRTAGAAFLRFAGTDVLIRTSSRMPGGALAAKYGATWTAGTATAQASVASVAETAEAEALPSATAVWSAADAGEGTVAAWPSRTGSWTFTASTVLPKDSTPPTASVFNGHKTVSFDGVSNSLFLTGNTPTPAANATNLVLAAVVKFNGRGTGVSSKGWQDWTPFVSMGYVGNGERNCWGLSFSSVGRLSAGVRDGWNNSLTVRSAARGLDDGELHTVVWSLSVGEDAAPQVLLVDGERTEAAAIPVKALTNSRILLGATEYNGFRYQAMELAELRFYRNVAFSAAQLTALAEELRATYGTPFVGNRADLGRGETCFTDLVLGEKGAVAGLGGTDVALHPGQTLAGSGTVEGTLVIRRGACFALDEMGNYPNIRHIRFEDGAILKLSSAGDVSSAKPLTVAGSVEFPKGTVYVDASDCGSRMGRAELLTWGGDLIDRGVSFEMAGRKKRHFAATLAPEAKTLTATFAGGTLFLIR